MEGSLSLSLSLALSLSLSRARARMLAYTSAVRVIFRVHETILCKVVELVRVTVRPVLRPADAIDQLLPGHWRRSEGCDHNTVEERGRGTEAHSEKLRKP